MSDTDIPKATCPNCASTRMILNGYAYSDFNWQAVEAQTEIDMIVEKRFFRMPPESAVAQAHIKIECIDCNAVMRHTYTQTEDAGPVEMIVHWKPSHLGSSAASTDDNAG